MIRILPNDKSDLEACANLALADDELVEPHLKELFTWLQDMSWPVAKQVSTRLSALGMELVPELRHILNSDNNLWKYGIVSDFLYDVNDDVYDALFFNLKRIQKYPTAGERKTQVNIKAEQLIGARKSQSHIVSDTGSNSTIIGFSQDATSPSMTVDGDVKNSNATQSLTSIEKTAKVISIDGNNFNTLEEFYLEVESQFLMDSFCINNLDGFNEVLQHCLERYSGGFILKWKHSETSKKRLGYNETIRQLQKRLEGCHPTQKKIVADAIERAKLEEGATVFDWLITIIEYQNISSKIDAGGKIQINLS